MRKEEGFNRILQMERNLPPPLLLTQNGPVKIWLAVISSLFTRQRGIKRGITKRGARESVRYSWAHSIGVCDGERERPEMRGRAQTREIIEVRVRSKLWSVLAMGREGALVFGPALNQKLNQLTCRTRGSEERRLY